MHNSFNHAPVAQLVEQWPLKPLVEGSSPSGCTLEIPVVSVKKPCHLMGLLLYHIYSNFVILCQIMDTDLMDTLQYSYVEYGFIYYAWIQVC